MVYYFGIAESLMGLDKGRAATTTISTFNKAPSDSSGDWTKNYIVYLYCEEQEELHFFFVIVYFRLHIIRMVSFNEEITKYVILPILYDYGDHYSRAKLQWLSSSAFSLEYTILYIHTLILNT